MPFGPEYGRCTECDTLICLAGPTDEDLKVVNDDTDYYGKQYWLEHQSKDLGLPDIYQRARNDLSERVLHWMVALLKFRLPPAKVLEIGCSHGAFVSSMRNAGFDASGIEMSPWVVEFARKTFDVPVSLGPVEELDIEAGSLDVIALMDVLEHLPDPQATMAHCMRLLKPDGLLLIQTPRFREEMRYEILVEQEAPFLGMLRPDQHIFLFTERSVAKLFSALNAEHFTFMPAMFPEYDMFFGLSRQPLAEIPKRSADEALMGSSQGRHVLALLDLEDRIRVIEADRAARLNVIRQLDELVRDRSLNTKTAFDNLSAWQAIRGSVKRWIR